MKRRVGIAGAVGLALVLSSCAATGGATDQVIIGSFGGDYDKFLQESVNPVFSETNPDTEVVFSSGDTGALVTKLMAEKSGQGSFDIAQLSLMDISSLIEAGALEKLDQSKIEAWDDLLPGLVNDYCVPHIQSPISIIYNADEITEAPTDWDDFFEPSFIDQAGTWGTLWSDYVFFGAAVLEAGGDPGADWSAGYDTALATASTLTDYGSTEQIGQGLLSGEINAVAGPKARAAQWGKDGTVNLKAVVPESGTFSYVSYSCIPANAPNMEAAYEYLNAELDPSAQLYFAENMSYAPTRASVELPADLLDKVGVSAEEAERILSVDWLAQVEPGAERRTLWNKASS